jgi:hypothetical protein
MTCYISGDNKKAYDYLTGIGYTLTKTTKTYHKRNKPIGQGIIYLVNWDKSKKEFDQLLINKNLRLHGDNGLRNETIGNYFIEYYI